VGVTINGAALAALDDEPLGWRYKGIPAGWVDRTPAQICAAAPDLWGAGVLGPVCVLRAEALAHNIELMARWCAGHGVGLAPHGKTHMSPQLFAKQAAAGAVALTVATISQARVYRAFGVDDILVANEIVDPAGLAWLAAELDADPGLRVRCWVDSERGVALMSEALGRIGVPRPVPVCVEVGTPGGRTGARTDAEVGAVAAAVASSPVLQLAGVAGYEGVLGQDDSPPVRAKVRAFLQAMRAAVLRCGPLFETGEVLVTAGGSTHFDLVAEVLADDWPAGLPVHPVVRSGCYLTHDDGLYARSAPLAFQPALSVWGQVCSVPEPGLALVTMGRRDVSFDTDLPVPRTPGHVSALNDQHAFLRSADIGLGQWVEFGISHPCTVFDKWPVIPVIDDRDRVVELVRTFF